MHRGLCAIFVLLALFDAFFALNFVSNTLGSHMVLQREPQRARIWGWANAGQEIALRLSSNVTNFQTKTQASADGAWEVLLPATPAGGPYNIVVKAANPALSAELEDILFGDVYICSGQSNMQMAVHAAFNSTEEIQKANDYPNIRVFTAALRIATTEQEELLSISETWSAASADSIGHDDWNYFSAACWFYGKNVYDATQVPLGLVASTWGGTLIQAWSPVSATEQCKESAPISNFKVQTVTPNAYFEDPNHPNLLWNAMMHPYVKMRVNGFVWYQGEQNNGHAAFYSCAFPAMINSWRTYFGENVPFYFVQLSTWKSGIDGSISDLRISQMSALSLPFTGMASAVDLSDVNSPLGDIHPRSKQEVGRRLSLLALHEIYRQDVSFTGPVPNGFRNYATDGDIVVAVRFNPNTLSGGLELRNVSCPTDAPQCGAVAEISVGGQWKPVTSYDIEGDEVSFHLAPTQNAKIDGIRYAYANYPLCAVYNKAGLPLTPFVHNF